VHAQERRGSGLSAGASFGRLTIWEITQTDTGHREVNMQKSRL